MRLVVVGHSYVTRFAQAKYVAMKQVVPDLSVRLIVPPAARNAFGTVVHERADGLGEDEVVPLPVWLNRSHMTYWFNPASAAAVLREFEPHHVHIEEDPHSLVGVEMACLAKRICPAATLSFFIWDNVGRQPMFPVGPLKRALTRQSLARCDLVICGNVESQRLLGSKGYRGRSAVLPQLGIDPEEYTSPPDAATRSRLRGPSPDTVVIGFVGRFVPEKGIIELLRALETLSALAWRCVLIGDGPLRDQLQTEWKSRWGERLLIVDPVPHLRVSEFMKCFDVFVFNSQTTPRWKEQLGLTLVQAMMAGVACIGSSSGAIPEVLGHAGLVVPTNDGQALQDALRSLVLSKAEREAWGALARQRALARYTHRVVAEQYASAFWSDAHTIEAA